MAVLLQGHPAGGGPGVEPRWTRSDKDGVGTAYSALSRVWFTVSKGILNEVYYPTIDRPQIRDLQYLITDGETFFHDERHLDNAHECLAPYALGYRITNTDPRGHFRIIKEVIADPHRDCVLMHTRLEADNALLPRLRLFALLAPHLEVGGRGNNGNVVRTNWGDVLAAHKGGTWLVLAASVPFLRCSCGYVGASDGWQDLAHDFRMDWEFDWRPDGNIALTGEIDLRQSREFVLALAFGETLHHALVKGSQALSTPFADHRNRFVEQWRRACDHLLPEKEKAAEDGGHLYHVSHALILAHEDKRYARRPHRVAEHPLGRDQNGRRLGRVPPGVDAGHVQQRHRLARGRRDRGPAARPHLSGLYAAGGRRLLPELLDQRQNPSGAASSSTRSPSPSCSPGACTGPEALQDFDPYPMVLKAASYLIQNGPATPQERWEENSGYSPSTLAAHIAALVCAAALRASGASRRRRNTSRSTPTSSSPTSNRGP